MIPLSLYIYIYICISIEVGESTRVVLGDIPQNGLARCSLDSRLLLSSFFARSPLRLPSLNTDIYRLPKG